MPPKAVAKEKAGNSLGAKSDSKPLGKLVPPSDTWDPAANPYKNDQKAVNSFFQRELETKVNEHIQDITKTAGFISKFEKDTHRIKKRQTFEYGMTLDDIDTMRVEIEKIKMQNDKLYAEMADSKALHDKLESELEDTKRRYGKAIDQMKTLKRESKTWQGTKDKLLRTEQRSHQLYKSNRKLRTILLKNKIDPNTDAREVHEAFNDYSDGEGSARSVKTNKTFPNISVRKQTKNRDTEIIEELNRLRKIQREEKNKGYGFLDAVFDQMSPDYFGFYTRQKTHPVKRKDTIRPGVMLPGIIKVHPPVKRYSYDYTY